MRRKLTDAEVEALTELSYKKSLYKRKKKIKDLTQDEMGKICAFHNEKGTSCLNQNCKCPLLFAGCCLKGFIEKLQYIERKVDYE